MKRLLKYGVVLPGLGQKISGPEARGAWLSRAGLAFCLLGGLIPTVVAGTLTGSVSSLTTNVDLTTAGKSDWVHWGLYTDTSVDRKWGVPAQIGALSTVSGMGGYTYVYQYSDNYNGYT
jgi:hypothetical protein